MPDDFQLEDNFTDVTSKALRGLGLTPGEAARRAGLTETSVTAFVAGAFDAELATRLAPVLGLLPAALATHPQYRPAALELESVARLKLPFHGDSVNGWLIRDGSTTLVFDTGDEPHSCARALAARGVTVPTAGFITHGHPDHIGGVADLGKLGIPLFGWDIAGAAPLQPGATLRYGALTLTACDLSGHAKPALGYHVAGLEIPILVTGDALFAGSIGGCRDEAAYRLARQTLRAVLSPLAAATVLLPGHGPATTLGEELRRNPFLAP